MGTKVNKLSRTDFLGRLNDLWNQTLETSKEHNPPFDLQITKETGTKETGTKETGTKETGAKETGAKETGAKETGLTFPDIRDREAALERLWIHYEQLCQWNTRLSLIGPGTADEVVERHYWESVLGTCFLKSTDRMLVDIGSGGGFPGFVLSALVPSLQCVLVEPREKKWAFLKSAVRKAGLLSCRALNARVEFPFSESLDLPDALDIVTSRALFLPRDVLAGLFDLYPDLRVLLWIGKEDVELPTSSKVNRSISLPGSDHRQIIEVVGLG